MPPLTPSRILATGPPFRGFKRLGAVLVLQLALGDLLEGDREVAALAGNVHHRRWVLAEAALAEAVEVAVYLPGSLRRDHDGRVVGVGMVQQLVNAWFDHRAGSLEICRAPGARFPPLAGGTVEIVVDDRVGELPLRRELLLRHL